MQSTFVYLLIPPLVAVLGAVVALVRPPRLTTQSAIQHFAAGLVFAAVSVEVLPNVKHQQAPIPVIVGAVLGVLAMLSIRWITQRAEKPSESAIKQLPVGLLAGVGVDMLVDGLLVGIGFSAGATAGLLLTFAVSVEILFVGLSVTSTLASKITRRKSLLVSVVLGLVFLGGSVLGITVFGAVNPTIFTIALSFSLIALLYLVTEELLVEAHASPETPVITASFFAGFILLLVVSIIAEMAG